ncbi:helix-turn-helix transcriptional regulator [Companilactobacillus zhachilii]|uniref:helix-turn-helix domain-containing protein n=1 Tax=Companilactobacillus zhachilii TaxID=2304606 RepID=UPI001923FA5D|nr:helix-turn-helix transcriptional regulator [Companilactobacillus zhachilii]MBL3530385.1 helix-turn-helix transcriptional regulator [Companilactobacillus zhachilii]
MTPGQKIKEYRKKNHMTQAELAEKLEISRPYMSEIESDKRNMSTRTVESFAKKLGIPSSELFDTNQYIDPRDASDFDKAPENVKRQFFDIATKFDATEIDNSMKYVNNFISNINPHKSEFDDKSIDLLSSVIKFAYINEPSNKNDDPTKMRLLTYIIDTISNYQNGNKQKYSKIEVLDNIFDCINAIIFDK